MNKLACEHTVDSIQCTWIEEVDDILSRCVDYKPKKCEGDHGIKPLKYICQQIDLKCNWHLFENGEGECVSLDENQGCLD